MNSVNVLIETAFYIEVKKKEIIYLMFFVKNANSYCEIMWLWYNSEHLFMIGGIYWGRTIYGVLKIKSTLWNTLTVSRSLPILWLNKSYCGLEAQFYERTLVESIRVLKAICYIKLNESDKNWIVKIISSYKCSQKEGVF